MKTVVNMKANVFDWFKSPTSTSSRFMKQAKISIQTEKFKETGIKWDYPDATGNGGMNKRIFIPGYWVSSSYKNKST